MTAGLRPKVSFLPDRRLNVAVVKVLKNKAHYSYQLLIECTAGPSADQDEWEVAQEKIEYYYIGNQAALNVVIIDDLDDPRPTPLPPVEVLAYERQHD